ncbi:hypothetical protein [Rhizobium leguminosarum]|nr:hypothetical protein [Rhizobium leguminosarum]
MNVKAMHPNPDRREIGIELVFYLFWQSAAAWFWFGWKYTL